MHVNILQINLSCMTELYFLSHSYAIFDHNKMPLGKDGHSWKKKTSDIKEIYDFKDVLGT